MSSPVLEKDNILSDNDLLHLAKMAKCNEDGVSVWRKMKNRVIAHVRAADLSDVEVIEQISAYLIARPIKERDSIVDSIEQDIAVTKKYIAELNKIFDKINFTPDDYQVSKVVYELNRVIDSHTANLARKSADGYTVNLDYEIEYRKTKASNAPEAISPYFKYGPQTFSDVYSKAVYYINDDLKNDYTYDNSLTMYKNNTAITKIVAEKVREFITEKLKENCGIKNEMIFKLMSEQRDTVFDLINKLTLSCEEMERQKAQAFLVVEPIVAISKELSEYLTLASNIKTIRDAIGHGDSLDVKNMERNQYVSMLAQYSSVALDSLSEVKSIISSTQSAKLEVDKIKSLM